MKYVCASTSSLTDEALIGELLENMGKSCSRPGISTASWPTMPRHLAIRCSTADSSHRGSSSFPPWFGGLRLFELRELTIAAGDSVRLPRPHSLWWIGGPGDNAQLVVRLTVCCRKTNGY